MEVAEVRVNGIKLLPFAPERGREVEDISRVLFPEYYDGSVKWKAGWQLDDPVAATAARSAEVGRVSRFHRGNAP